MKKDVVVDNLVN